MTETDPPVADSERPPSPRIRPEDRRAGFRRETDRRALLQSEVLGRIVDSLALEAPAVDRLGSLLSMLAGVAHAKRTAILRAGADRQVAVLIRSTDDPTAGEELAAWLDAEAPRSRADRAAGGKAAVLVIPFDSPPRGSGGRAVPDAIGRTDPDDGVGAGLRALRAVDTTAGAALGFDFDSEADRARLPDRLPTAVARHVAAGLEIAWSQLDRSDELADLRAQDAHRSRFISTVVHELRTPLTGIGGYLDLILGGRVADESVRQDFLERSRHIVLSMSELVGDLLEISRLEAGSLDLEIGPFSMADVGERVLERLVPQAMDRRIELRSDLPPRMRSATGDRRRVEQILTNLLGNAMKFTPTGGAVELAGWTSGPVAIYAVRDDGDGIAGSDRERVFERFVRLSAHQRVTGSGLGLPIARELARSMGGDLAVASVPNAGSSFVLALPGPTQASGESVAEAIRATLSEEEFGLEELSVRRALRAAGRPVPNAPRSATSRLVDGISAPQ